MKKITLILITFLSLNAFSEDACEPADISCTNVKDGATTMAPGTGCTDCVKFQTKSTLLSSQKDIFRGGSTPASSTSESTGKKENVGK